MDSLTLQIITPERLLFEGNVELVTLPGTQGLFTVLHNHAALISSLEKGHVIYRVSGKEQSVMISSGFVEIHDNKVKVCIEQSE